MKPAVRAININDWAPKLDVDNRISIHFYYRIADNLLKQASIYREEENVIDLYIILLRFSSLLCETIPSHRDYHALKSTFKTKLLNVLNELEALKPIIQCKVDELNKGWISHLYGPESSSQSSTAPEISQSTAMASLRTSNQEACTGIVSQSASYGNIRNQFASVSQLRIDKQLPKSYLSLPCPKEETLSRHSILGPNGLGGKWNEPITGIRVQYPSNVDIAQKDMFSMSPTNQSRTMEKASNHNAFDSDMTSVLSLDDGRWLSHSSGSASLPVEFMQENFNFLNINQPSPPPVLAHVMPQQEVLSIPPSRVADPRPGPAKPLNAKVPGTKTFQHLHIPVQMMNYFLRVAEKNTAKNLETCAILAGSLKDRRFCVTTLIVPKQEATSDSCQTTNEEEIFDYQDQHSLFPLGWIHTHPTQTCFMSSVDLHTHYSYQIMLPEAIAIVMAPTDDTRKHGIFRLSDPGGISVIRNCQERGFHPHEEPSDGNPLYEHCSHVYLNPNLKFESVDLRDR